MLLRRIFASMTASLLLSKREFTPVIISRMSETIGESLRVWEKHLQGANVGVAQSPEDISAVVVNIEYVTDIQPMQRETIREEIGLNRGER